MAPTPRELMKPVPHHPAAGGDVKDPVLALEIRMEDQLFQVVDQNAARPLDHALGLARGPGGKHDEDRMVEGQLFKLKSRRLFLCQKVFIMDRVWDALEIGIMLPCRKQ